MVGSLRRGSSGPRPVISSRISDTKSLSSCVFSGSRSTSTYCDTSCWTCLRTSSSGTLSSAERLISSIRRRCRRTFASRSFSLSNGLSVCWAGAFCSAGCSGDTVQATPSSADDAGSSAGSSGAAVRRAVNRPAMSAHHRSLELLQQSHRLTVGAALCGGRIQHQFLELRGNLVAGLDLIQRHAPIDGLAYERIVIGYRGQE